MTQLFCSHCGTAAQNPGPCTQCGGIVAAAATPPPTPPYGAQQPYAPYAQQPATQSKSANGRALASLILGLVSIFAWFIPLFGLPTSIAAIATGASGLKSEKKGMAIAGIVLGVIFLIVSIINFIAGAVIAAGNIIG